MKAIHKMIGGMVLTWLLITTSGTGLAQTSINATGIHSLQQMSDVQLNSFLDTLDATPQLSAEALPKSGNFYSLQHPEWPPLPGNGNGLSAWQIGNSGDSFLLNDVGYDYNPQPRAMTRAMSMNSPLGIGDFSPNDSTSGDSIAPPDISNYLKYMAQSFSVVDTNDAAANDTNLYNALLAFGDDTNTAPTLQIATYQPGCLILKASHFDYSSETRDFCLVVGDKVETPLFKNIDISHPTNNIQNGGWLVQGSVPAWQVTDPMYLVVSNISLTYNAFFRVIPYDGPQVQLTGYNPYDIVSNTIPLQATITDLSGITNEVISINIDGAAARYSIGSSNVINFETKYNVNGVDNIYLNAANAARIYDPSNPPDNSKIFFSASGTIPLDFENDSFLAFASDNCPLLAGTNYIYYYVNKAQQIGANIKCPTDGRLLASYSGYATAPGYIAIPWNFTETNGTTQYTNDTYVVTFIAYDPSTFVSTNSIDKGGNIRLPSGCLLTYEWEDPSTTSGLSLNNAADSAIAGDLLTLYQDIYEWWSLTWYDESQVGPNRDLAQCHPYNAAYKTWAGILGQLTNSSTFSELTIAQAHGSGATIGGGPYLPDKFYSIDLQRWILYCSTPHNWRLRKASLFTCYNGDIAASTGFGAYSSWADACGIRPAGFQQTSLTYKNCGLFFGGGLPQAYQNSVTGVYQATANVAECVDQAWVCGLNQYPGGCDPTYSFDFAINATRGIYPALNLAVPLRGGFGLCVYNPYYDEDLRNLNTSGVKTR